jgi:hypothetical protein
MKRLSLAIVVACALSLAATGAVASGPPLVNETDHAVNQPFTENPGFDCATGLPTLITGVFTGVLHTLVQADGTVHFTGVLRGSLAEDDLPPDGVTDATLTFVLVLHDLVFSSGSEVHHATLSGAGIAAATGAAVRIHEVVQIVLDEHGDPRIEFVRLRCF